MPASLKKMDNLKSEVEKLKKGMKEYKNNIEKLEKKYNKLKEEHKDVSCDTESRSQCTIAVGNTRQNERKRRYKAH